MNSKEIITAMHAKSPIVYGGIEYKCIAEYILYINLRGEECKSVTLLDRNGGTVVRADADKIELAERTDNE